MKGRVQCDESVVSASKVVCNSTYIFTCFTDRYEQTTHSKVFYGSFPCYLSPNVQEVVGSEHQVLEEGKTKLLNPKGKETLLS